MDLYIMRHGIAVEASEWRGDDFDRPLTIEGRDRTEQVVAKLVKDDLLKVDAIWSSPVIRAKETADIAGKLLKLPVKIVPPLACGATLSSLAKYAKKDPPPPRLLCVGHEPDCGELVAELLGDPNEDYSFKRAEVAHVSGEMKEGGMKLIWKKAPKKVLND